VRIKGNEKISSESIISLLEESGVGVGTKKKGLDIDAIENRALIVSDEISWLSINIIGNVAEVEIREVMPVPEDEDYVASNLLATKNGTVVELVEIRGNLGVRLGEAVSEGQLLVGGIYGSETEGFRLVRARGKVMALCEYDYTVDVPLKYEKKVYTGNKKVKKSLIFFKKEVKFFRNRRNLYASCDTIERVEYLNLFGLGELPVGIRTVEYIEYETTEGILGEKEAAEQANYLLWQRLYADAPNAELCSKHIYGRLEGDTYILTARIECIENIAKECEIEVEIEG
jgi:similar to stage IV sporulation protein